MMCLSLAHGALDVTSKMNGSLVKVSRDRALPFARRAGVEMGSAAADQPIRRCVRVLPRRVEDHGDRACRFSAGAVLGIPLSFSPAAELWMSRPSPKAIALSMGAALAVTMTTSVAWAEEGALLAGGEMEAEQAVVAEQNAGTGEGSSVGQPTPPVGDDSEVVEMSFDDVQVGQAPDIAAQKAKVAERLAMGLTEQEQKAVENNQRIKQYNNAPAEFPTFVREGYDVKCITTPGFVTQDDGLVYKDFVVGDGKMPQDGEEATFHYIAYNENGGTIDSTYRKNQPASTRLGINGMIPGFEEGLKGMKEGGRRRVIVPPELGPPTGPATFFSAKQWEVFDIELIKVKSCERVQTGFMVSSVVCE